MKERPILFSGPMVRAILEGRKTQTRRIVKLVKTLPGGKGFDAMQKPGTRTCLPVVDGKWQWSPAAGEPWQPYPHIEEFCPYGQPGDRLWVRETWQELFDPKEKRANCWEQTTPPTGHCVLYAASDAKPNLATWTWRPSIHMPRWASRLTLEIVRVRVERLQDITEDDALAEGCQLEDWSGDEPMSRFSQWTGDGNPSPQHYSYRNAYRRLWESINGAGSWALNPWVWVVEFKRVTGDKLQVAG